MKIIPLSINFSIESLRGKSFVERILETCKKYQIPTKYIEIEITERVHDEKNFEIKSLIKSFYVSQYSITGEKTINDLKTILRAKNLREADWGGATNLQAVFDKLLQHSLKYPLSDLPKAVIIISDMEFDEAAEDQTNFLAIDAKYKAAGLERPTLIFWRVDVKLNQQPVTFDDNGTILINGYSPAIMKTILSLDMDELANITPMNLFLKAVNTDKYSFVDTIFKDKL